MKMDKLKSIEVANKRLLRESFWDEDNGTITEDEFEWVKGLDVDAAEKEIYKPFKDIAYEWDVDARAIYDTLI